MFCFVMFIVIKFKVMEVFNLLGDSDVMVISVRSLWYVGKEIIFLRNFVVKDFVKCCNYFKFYNN